MRYLSGESWRFIPDFPAYSISTTGRVRNDRTGRLVATSVSNFGHVKISLLGVDGRRTMSVALLVAQAFVAPPDELCDNVILKDGNLQNVDYRNLELRPRWFAWKYARQVRCPPLSRYLIPVYNFTIGQRYPSIVACGMEHGLLFLDIWRSANIGVRVYPYKWQFEFAERV